VPAPGDDALAVMRLDGDGSIDRTFSDDGIALADFGVEGEQATGVDVDAHGRPVVAVSGAGAFGVLRLRASGGRDTTFGTNGLARATSAAGDASDLLIDDDDESIVLAGSVGDAPLVARLLPTGEVDEDFGTNGLTAPLPFAPPPVVRRVVASPDATYVVGADNGLDQRPPVGLLALAKVFAQDAPAARVVSAPDLRAPQTGSYVFHVQWRDADGIDTTTIGMDDVRVTDPGGYVRTATLVSPPTVRDSTDVVARYKVAPPNGTQWTGADDGTYTIHALVGGVQSLTGAPNAAAELGTFRVAIA
jgi:hypothetical protein